MHVQTTTEVLGARGVDPRSFPDLAGLTGPSGGTVHGLSLELRFWLKVNRTEGCWLWTAATSGSGYGRLKNERGRRPYQLQASRVAWRVTQGPIPQGLHVLHGCDNPACVRPSHLFLGTHSDNMRDAVRKGRHRCYLGPAPKGEVSPCAVLTRAQALEIRRLRAAGVSGVAVARRFGISQAQVSRIHTGQRWPHLEGANAA